MIILLTPNNLYYHPDENVKKEFIAKYEKSKNEDLSCVNSEIYFYHKAPHLVQNGNPIPKVRRVKIENGAISILDYEKEFNTDAVFSINIVNLFI